VGLNGLVIAVFEISLVQKLKRFRRLRVAALGTTLAGVGLGLTGLSLHWAWLLVAVLVWTAGEILASPQQMAFIADWAPPAARGRYLSLYQAMWSLAFALNPVFFLPLHARLGERAFWPLMTALALPAAAVLLHLDRTADQPERLRGVTRAHPELLAAITPEG
jgi:MFS family permease